MEPIREFSQCFKLEDVHIFCVIPICFYFCDIIQCFKAIVIELLLQSYIAILFSL